MNRSTAWLRTCRKDRIAVRDEDASPFSGQDHARATAGFFSVFRAENGILHSQDRGSVLLGRTRRRMFRLVALFFEPCRPLPQFGIFPPQVTIFETQFTTFLTLLFQFCLDLRKLPVHRGIVPVHTGMGFWTGRSGTDGTAPEEQPFHIHAEYAAYSV